MHGIEEIMMMQPDAASEDEDESLRQSHDDNEEAARLRALHSGSQRVSALRGLPHPLHKIISIIESTVAAETGGAKGKRKSKASSSAPVSGRSLLRFDSFHSMGQLFAVPLAEGDADDEEALQHGVLYNLGYSRGQRVDNQLLLHFETHPRVLASPERFGLPASADSAAESAMSESRHVTKRKRQARAKKIEQLLQQPIAFVGLYLEKPGVPKSPRQLIPVACSELLDDGCMMLRTETQAKQMLSAILRAVSRHEAARNGVDEWALAYRIKDDDEEEEAEKQQMSATMVGGRESKKKRTRRSRVAED